MRQVVLRHVADSGLDPAEFAGRDALGVLTEAAARLPNAAEFLAEAEELLVEIELAACEGATEAEGAAATLAWLMEQDIRVGIVTRNSPRAVARVLNHIPLPYEVLL